MDEKLNLILKSLLLMLQLKHGNIPEVEALEKEIKAEVEKNKPSPELRINQQEWAEAVTSLAPQPVPKPKDDGSLQAPSPNSAYQKAYDLYPQGDIENAKEEWKKFLKTYPNSRHTEDAHYWLAECYYAEKKFEDAVLEFDEIIKKFPKGNKVPDSLFRQAEAFLELKDKDNAKLFLREIIQRFPKSSQAERARKKLKEI